MFPDEIYIITWTIPLVLSRLPAEKYYILSNINYWNVYCRCAVQTCTRSSCPTPLLTDKLKCAQDHRVSVGQSQDWYSTFHNPSPPPVLLLFHKLLFGIKFSLNNASLPLFCMYTYTKEIFSCSCLLICCAFVPVSYPVRAQRGCTLQHLSKKQAAIH